MSVYQPEVTKPTEDYPRIPLDPETWTTTAITVAFFSKYPAQLVLDMLIVNLDTTNSLTVKLNDLTAFTIAAGSVISLSNIIIWKMVITPNAVTGTGFIFPQGILKALVTEVARRI